MTSSREPDVSDEQLGTLVSLLECDVEAGREALARAGGDVKKAIAIYFEQQQQQTMLIDDDDAEVEVASGARCAATDSHSLPSAAPSLKNEDFISIDVDDDIDRASQLETTDSRGFHSVAPVAEKDEVINLEAEDDIACASSSKACMTSVLQAETSGDVDGLASMAEQKEATCQDTASGSSTVLVHREDLPCGVFKRKGGYQAQKMFAGFVISAMVREQKCAEKNHEAMERVKAVLHQKVVESPQPAEEFVKTAKAVIDDIRKSTPSLVIWRYFAELTAKKQEGKTSKADRFNTTSSLHDALQGWLSLRKKQGIDEPIICLDTPTVDKARKAANDLAQRILDELPADGAASDADMLKVLRKWGFEENDNRVNVLPTGRSFVHSDTLGLVTVRGSAKPIISRATSHKAVFQLLGRWARSGVTKRYGKGPMPYTTITLNRNYSARRHRDRNNLGPSVGRAIGNFSRGRLRYWKSDDKKTNLEDLHVKDCEPLDLHSEPVVFNGNLAHEVEDYDGEERFSVILFTHGKYEEASESVRGEIEAAGCEWPTLDTLQALAKWDPSGAEVARPHSGRKRRFKPLKATGKLFSKQKTQERLPAACHAGSSGGKQKTQKRLLAACPARSSGARGPRQEKTEPSSAAGSIAKTSAGTRIPCEVCGIRVPFEQYLTHASQHEDQRGLQGAATGFASAAIARLDSKPSTRQEQAKMSSDAGAAASPNKKLRRECSVTEKTWVCPFAKCMHRMDSGLAGHVAHIARQHCRAAKSSCQCRHGCSKCVPAAVRDEPSAEFRWAVISDNGNKVAQELARLQPAADVLQTAGVIEARTEFLREALQSKDPGNRQSLCSSALNSLPADRENFSTDARRLIEIFKGFSDQIEPRELVPP